MPRFFIPTPLHAGLLAMPQNVARHISVLRLADGDALTLFDGSGGEWAAQLVGQGKQFFAQVNTHSTQDRSNAHAITLVQALTTAEKMDWIVQKCTELGVARIVPFAAGRSLVKLDGERAAKRVAHLQAVAVAACEQCGLNRVPHLAPVQTLAQCLSVLQGEQARIITLALQDAIPLHQLAAPSAGAATAVVIGPEGDFTQAELALLDAARAQRASLGPRILRTETAGLATLAMLQALWR
jgi:16S rRNA (uracil1498-N3)-methyltransferase